MNTAGGNTLPSKPAKASNKRTAQASAQQVVAKKRRLSTYQKRFAKTNKTRYDIGISSSDQDDAKRQVPAPIADEVDDATTGDHSKGDNIQANVLHDIEEICHRYGIDSRRALRAVRTLLGKKYKPTLDVPTSAEARWNDCPQLAELTDLNPIAFLDRLWGPYLDQGVLTYRILNVLDPSIVIAVKNYCTQKGLDSAEYLPPPDRRRNSPGKYKEIPSPKTVVELHDLLERQHGIDIQQPCLEVGPP